MIDFNSLILIRLSQNFNIKPFDCGDTDLNGFLFDDAKDHLTELMAVTYIFEHELKTVAYFCLLNDKVAFDNSVTENKKNWNRFNRRNNIPNPKRRYNYPAVKIGRLAVAQELSGQGMGCFILDAVKSLVIEKQNVGCRFITVDAYDSAFKFYQKNDFDFLSTQDEGESTRLMFFDLKRIAL